MKTRKRIVTVLSLLVVLGTTVFGQLKRLPLRDSLAITHVTVIDATGALPKEDMTVIVTGDRIAEVGKSRDVRVVHTENLIRRLNPYT